MSIAIFVPPSSNKSKTEQEIMAANGGHVYFSVHLAHCPECRAELERRKQADSYSLGWVIGTFIVCLAFGFTIAAMYWDGVFDGWKYRKRWWLP